jgi:Arc/MetJ-type ribon-helix-helix transcriptional regulator
MSYQVPPDVERLVSEQMRQGSYASEDDVLRDALDALAERNADLAAIRAGIEDMEAGRVQSVSEVDAQIRRNLGFAPPQ